MMDFNTIFFIVLSVIVIIYILSYLKTNKRTHALLELLFIAAYIFVIVILIFPQTITLIGNIFGVNGLNFIIYLSIFIAYLILFMLYNKTETQRIEITKLTREIALLTKQKKKK